MLKVAVIMGSDSDLPTVTPYIETLKRLDIPFVVRIISAHRTPEVARAFSAGARQDGFGVLIAAAGKAAHLAGTLAAHTTLPVIGIPVGASLGGMDALLSTVQMPPGIPVATVGIDAAQNAALLAAQMLAIGDAALCEKLDTMRADMTAAAQRKDEAIRDQFE